MLPEIRKNAANFYEGAGFPRSDAERLAAVFEVCYEIELENKEIAEGQKANHA